MYVQVPPLEIESRSLAVIDAEVKEPRPFAGDEWIVARRMIHTTADFDLLGHIRFHPEAIKSGVEALLAGADIVTDTRMALSGIPVRRLEPLRCKVRCLIDEPAVAKRARSEGVTRAWAAVDEVMAHGGADIFVIGNAPTALYRLLNWMERGARPPRLIVGMPVGFVNAAESKELLMAQDAIPYISIAGRKGGSSLAASVVNALLKLVRKN
ncbi:MAG: precorrin-8X methylmutase [Desulfomicrobium sp.]|jgi:precorrin-8X/cobalt-precorrin-8 methylmutase|nr:precorrin-8X methylmutase [Pseudomonadota bacterium]MBV1713708.1 precorrin-8X methylmutase [Desulfomicrobium sp.]MBU4572244.1 precorrin-8X methylmutase [Pseudomonadota bacterium]MBU4594222.1 precorrin-8X methylmutase [Pseudomonadota bacterium]MBV1721493.1 precorrin-8X methylmutase [Desulfomicrobium sp.]